MHIAEGCQCETMQTIASGQSLKVRQNYDGNGSSLNQ